MNHYVVLSVNSHPDYRFLAPLTAILWLERTVYKPLIFSSKPCQSLRMLNEAGAITLLEQEMPNDRLYVKLLRWYAWSSVLPEDALMPSDVDLWPIDGSWYQRPIQKPVTLFYSNAFQYKRHTTCHVRATAETWRAIVCPDASHPPSAKEKLKSLHSLYAEDDERRHSDDAAMSEVLMKWPGYPNGCEMVERTGGGPPNRRIDRSNWPDRFNIDCMIHSDLLGNMIDAHLPRDCGDRRVWTKVLPLFDALAPKWSGFARVHRQLWERELG